MFSQNFLNNHAIIITQEIQLKDKKWWYTYLKMLLFNNSNIRVDSSLFRLSISISKLSLCILKVQSGISPWNILFLTKYAYFIHRSATISILFLIGAIFIWASTSWIKPLLIRNSSLYGNSSLNSFRILSSVCLLIKSLRNANMITYLFLW